MICTILSIIIFLFLSYFVFKRKKLAQYKRSIIITIIGAILVPIGILIDTNLRDSKEKIISNIDAKLLTYDILEDSVFFKFEIENIGTEKVTKIWHISELNGNFFLDNLQATKKLSHGEEALILSFARLKMDLNQTMISPTLYVGYDIQENRKDKTYYKRFDFVITILGSDGGSYSPISHTEPEEIEGPEELYSKLDVLSKKLAQNDGFILQSFTVENIKSQKLILIKGYDKEVWYNTSDSNVYFTRSLDNELMIFLSSKIDKNYNRPFHTYAINWTDSSTLLIVDNQRNISDKEMRNKLKQNPALVLRETGLYFFNRGDYKNATNNLKKSIDIDTLNSFITYEKLFLSYEKMGFLSLGVDVLEKAIINGHKDSSIVLNLALAYENIGNNKKADEIYSLDHINSKSHKGFILHIKLHDRLGNYRVSDSLYKMGLDKYPNSTHLLNDYAIRLIKTGDTINARKHLKEALKHDPNNQIIKKNLLKLDSISKRLSLNFVYTDQLPLANT